MTPAETVHALDDRAPQGATATHASSDPSNRRTRWRADPLVRAATALALNSGATSVLGLAFWLLAARRYPAAVVGQSAAVISLLLFLANAAECNLGSALVRFLPTAGAGSRRLLVCCYAIAASGGLVAGAASLLIFGHLALIRSLSGLGLGGDLWLCGTVAIWCIFALEDAVLVALRGARFVPMENAFYGIAKIAALVLLATTLPRLGLFAAWTAPMALTVIPVNVLIFRSLLRAHERSGAKIEAFTGRTIARFVGFEYSTSLATTAAQSLLPLVVLAELGAAANGYFYVVWAAASAFDVALNNLGTALVAEGARDQRRLVAMIRGLAIRIASVFVPVALGLCLVAPRALLVVGRAFSEHDTTLLRCLTGAVACRILILLWMSMNRVHRTVGRVLAVQCALSTSILASTAVALRVHPSISTVGVTYLCVQLAFAAIVAPSFLRSLRRSPKHLATRLAQGAP